MPLFRRLNFFDLGSLIATVFTSYVICSFFSDRVPEKGSHRSEKFCGQIALLEMASELSTLEFYITSLTCSS